MADRDLNQKLIIDADKLSKTRFVIVGAGAIGSFTTIALSKMGMTVATVYDFDSLENHNFANQMYPVSQIDKPKVDALKAVAKDFGDCDIQAIKGPWTPDNAVIGDIVISAVDNMDIRKALWEYYKDRCSLFIDGRMGAYVIKVFGVDTKNLEARAYYESTLHSQAQAAPERCGEKSIIYTVLLLSGFVVSQVKEWVMGGSGGYRPTAVILDALNTILDKTYHVEPTYEAYEDVGEPGLEGVLPQP